MTEYIVSKNGGHYQAVSCGVVAHTGTAQEVIQATINDMSRGLVVCKDIDPDSVLITYKPDVVVQYLWGDLIRWCGAPTAYAYYYEFDYANAVFKIRCSDPAFPPTLVLSSGPAGAPHFGKQEVEIGSIGGDLVMHSLCGDTILQTPRDSGGTRVIRFQKGTGDPVDMLQVYDNGFVVFINPDTQAETFRVTNVGDVVPGKGLVIKSPSGLRYRLSVSDTGVLTSVRI